MAKASESTKGFLGQLKATLASIGNAKEITLDNALQLTNEKIKIPLGDLPISLEIGKKGKKLCLTRDISLDPESSVEHDSLILFDPERYYSKITGFLRLNPGKKLILGMQDSYQSALFHYPKNTATQHLSITHKGDSLLFKDHGKNGGTLLSPLPDKKHSKQQLIARRLTLLSEIRTIYGGPIEKLPPAEALKTLQQVNDLLEREPCRPRDSLDQPGGVVTLPDKMVPIIIGDLHAQVDNLLSLLSQNEFLEMMGDGKAAMIFLGDAVHKEVDGEMEEMESSLLIMDMIFRLKLWFPQQVFYVRGNHDCFSEDIGKDGIPQGLLWKSALEKQRGKDYREAMDRFYELLPYVALSQDFVACHAAPPKSKVSMDLLINIQQFPGLIKELTCNRPKTANRPAGYTQGDIKRFRKTLGLAETADMFVGHTPLDREDTLWLDVGGIAHHHVVFSGNNPWIGVFTRIGDRLIPLRYHTENLLPIINALPQADALEDRELLG
jgi:hypothetical protein